MKLWEKISWLRGRLQQGLFLDLEECWEQPLTEKEQRLVTILELVEQIVEKIRAEKGQVAIDNLVMLCRDLLKPFATYAHSYVQKILQEAK